MPQSPYPPAPSTPTPTRRSRWPAGRLARLRPPWPRSPGRSCIIWTRRSASCTRKPWSCWRLAFETGPSPGHPAGRGRAGARGGRGLADRLRGRGPQPGVGDVRPRLRRLGAPVRAGGHRDRGPLRHRRRRRGERSRGGLPPMLPDIEGWSASCTARRRAAPSTTSTRSRPSWRNCGALLIVDAVASFGGMRCDFTSWQADLVVVAPQKCLGGPAEPVAATRQRSRVGADGRQPGRTARIGPVDPRLARCPPR